MRNLLCLAIGLVFGIGLCLSGMTHPDKVIGFLDIAGLWDPSLAFVMGGAIAVGVIAFSLAKKRERDLFGGPMELPTRRTIDRPLVIGSVIFGVGWGLVGICPGPGVVDVGFFELPALVFVAAMALGMVVHKVADLRGVQMVEQDA
jgi:uncharacterized protein